MKPNENAPARKYKRYDETFQRSTVEHWMLSGKSARQVAQELGLNVQSLQKWKQKFKALPAGQVAGTMEALQDENRRLQKELHRMMQQRVDSAGISKPWSLRRLRGAIFP